MLGLRFCARAFSSCGERGPLFIAVHGPLTIAASLVAEHRLQTRRLSSCGSRAQLLRGMWDLPRKGLRPVSPALAGRFSTTAPPGKPGKLVLMKIIQARKSWLSQALPVFEASSWPSSCPAAHLLPHLLWASCSDSILLLQERPVLFLTPSLYTCCSSVSSS